MILCTDRGTRYFYTPKACGPVGRRQLTNVRSRASRPVAPSIQLAARRELDATRVGKQHSLVGSQGIQLPFVSFDERASSSLRGIASGLRYSSSRRYSSAIRPERLSSTRQNSFSMKASIWRVERGKVAATHAFSFSCCSPFSWQALPSWPNHARALIPSSSYRRHQLRTVCRPRTEPWRSPRSSSHRRAIREHWRVAPTDAPPIHPAPRRSDRLPQTPERQRESCPKDESKNRLGASDLSDFQ